MRSSLEKATGYNMTAGGLILHLQRLSTEDGPGIRTTVFFKGCPLRCAWCHNPESLSPKPELQWYAGRCMDCRTCLEACPRACLRKDENGWLVIDRAQCDGCGICAQTCPTNALELLGVSATASTLLQELLKDRAYYAQSGGGVTLSGGEPTLQTGFAKALLQGLQEVGIHTALDTCGLCPQRSLERMFLFIDLFLFDLKFVDPTLHRRYTGAGNVRILQNLRWLVNRLQDDSSHKMLWIRTPLIPGATLAESNIREVGEFVAALGSTVDHWELCAFNNLCRDKYQRLDMEWDYSITPLLERDDLDMAGAWARSSGVDPERVFVTGTARVNR